MPTCLWGSLPEGSGSVLTRYNCKSFKWSFNANNYIYTGNALTYVKVGSTSIQHIACIGSCSWKQWCVCVGGWGWKGKYCTWSRNRTHTSYIPDLCANHYTTWAPWCYHPIYAYLFMWFLAWDSHRSLQKNSIFFKLHYPMISEYFKTKYIT